MKHYASAGFWEQYYRLPKKIQSLADKNFELLKSDSHHPSLHFKKIDNFYSVRVGLHYRSLAISVEDGALWFWIGNHDEYDRMIK